MKDIFFDKPEAYEEKLDPFKSYLYEVSKYIELKYNVNKEKAYDLALTFFKKHFKDKELTHFQRKENGDREVIHTTLTKYITHIKKENKILVPTFTSYMRFEEKPSILSQFIQLNVTKRSQAKKIAQKAKAEGNQLLAISKNNEQNLMKINNNSLSGAFAQEACILYNPTAHSTLTSITRTITSLSNASNERLIAGNRYLPRPIDVLNYCVYCVSYCNETLIEKAMNEFNLHYPSTEDVIKVLKYSSDLYFRDDHYYNRYIIPFVEKLTKVQKAAIIYTGDLYHLRVFNENFIRTLLDELTQKKEGKDLVDPIASIENANENILNFVHQIFFSSVKGYGKDYTKMLENYLAHDIAKTVINIEEVLTKYKLFFQAFFKTKLFAPNSHKLRFMRRRVVVLSDTDSTCCALDEWVKWYYGSFYINDKTIAIAGCVSFIAAQSIIHQLALLSSYMNIDKIHLNKLAMKNEFLWFIHVPAEVSKHYFAYTVMQEGNVFKEPDIEIKGVHLKNSAIPKPITEDAKNLIKEILSKASNNEKISIYELIHHVITIEKGILESIKKGESIYLKKTKIKDKEAYALDEMRSPYQRHKFWEEVFSLKYGMIEEPPYDVVKVPTTLTSKRKLKSWLESIEDDLLRQRLIDWLIRYKKDTLPTLYLNESYTLAKGLPEEFISCIDSTRIVLDITLQHRIILESLGIILDDKKLILEQFKF